VRCGSSPESGNACAGLVQAGAQVPELHCGFGKLGRDTRRIRRVRDTRRIRRVQSRNVFQHYKRAGLHNFAAHLDMTAISVLLMAALLNDSGIAILGAPASPRPDPASRYTRQLPDPVHTRTYPKPTRDHRLKSSWTHAEDGSVIIRIFGVDPPHFRRKVLFAQRTRRRRRRCCQRRLHMLLTR